MLPDLDSVYICPWDKTMAIIFADLYWEDKPYNVCPRQALKRSNAKSARRRIQRNVLVLNLNLLL